MDLRLRILSGVLACIVLFTGCVVPTDAIPQTYDIVIDPGHGGFDGGTVAVDGTMEKDINLLIALHLRDMLVVCGLNVVMTRDTDVSTQSVDATTIREKKVSDIHNRLSLYESSATVISVHQNHYTSSKYSGTQVFYSANHPQSEVLAAMIQQSVVARLQPHNNRQYKSASDGIYLMHHTAVPAVLVECGFMSNAEELALLKDTQYRRRMAWAICLGYWEYTIECEG